MTNEEQYWADKAALLDPDCYVKVTGTDWQRTVPQGKVWYLVSAWQNRYVDTNFKWHHRNMDEPLMLPPGFTLRVSDYDTGTAYYADPSIVQATDSRYQTDPKGLYFERINRLRTIPFEYVGCHIPVNSLPGVAPKRNMPFPTDCERILLRHIDCHDGCWLILYNGVGSAMNTQNEVDDIRPVRFTKSMMVPIRRSDYPSIYLGHGNAQNNPAGVQTYNGWGTAQFQRLPADW